VLIAFANAARKTLRENDKFGRYGGEEWLLNKARSGILVSVLRVSARAGSIYKVSCSYLIYSESYSRCMKMQKKRRNLTMPSNPQKLENPPSCPLLQIANAIIYTPKSKPQTTPREPVSGVRFNARVHLHLPTALHTNITMYIIIKDHSKYQPIKALKRHFGTKTNAQSGT
jgi:hypothetical protein